MDNRQMPQVKIPAKTLRYALERRKAELAYNNYGVASTYITTLVADYLGQ